MPSQKQSKRRRQQAKAPPPPVRSRQAGRRRASPKVLIAAAGVAALIVIGIVLGVVLLGGNSSSSSSEQSTGSLTNALPGASDVEQQFGASVAGMLPLTEEMVELGSSGLFSLRSPSSAYALEIQRIAASIA